jgi:hypothetical protein
MAQNKFLSFLNSLDKGASDRNSITEFLANILTPGDNMEYVDGQLLGSGGKPVENIGDRTYYGTLGQANFAGNDPVKDGLLSKMTSAPPKLRPLGLLNKGQRDPVNDMMPGENTFAYQRDPVNDMMPGERQIQYQRDPINDIMPGERQIQYQPDPTGDMMPGEGDFSYAVGSGRGNGAMEQQTREAQVAFNDYLNTLDPNMVDTAINNPEIMDIIRKMFFTANPGLIRGMGGYN